MSAGGTGRGPVPVYKPLCFTQEDPAAVGKPSGCVLPLPQRWPEQQDMFRFGTILSLSRVPF